MRQIHKQIIYDMALLENIEIRELPIGELVENTGQIPNVPKNPRKITKEKRLDYNPIIRVPIKGV